MLPPKKKLNGAFRSFVQKVAASTASRRELSLHLPPDPLAGPSSPWSPWSTASSKSNQSASKLLAANLYGSFHLGEQPKNIAGNDVVARLRESAELANCWRAKLLVELCPFSPDADPALFDAFSLVDAARLDDTYFFPYHNRK